MNMHAASGLCTHGVSNVGGVSAGPARLNSNNGGGVTAGPARLNSSNGGGVTAGQMGHGLGGTHL